MVEALIVGRYFEPLARREDGDVGNPGPPFPRPVTAKRVTRLRREEVTCNLRAVASGGSDDRGTIYGARVGVVDNHRSASGQGGGDQLLLPSLRLTVAHGVLADQRVRAGESFTIERRFA